MSARVPLQGLTSRLNGSAGHFRYFVPSDVVDRVAASIDPDDCVALLRTLVRTRSTNPPARELTLANLVWERLNKAGLDCELLVFDQHRANLVARVHGDGTAPGLIYSAHFDTVPEGEQPWTYPPYAGEVHGGRLYGRGAADVKSGMAAIIMAAEAIAASDVKLRGDLILAFTSDETSSCTGAKLLVAGPELHGAGAILVSEATGLNVGIAEKAALWLRVVAHGRTSHGSQPHIGDNAIRKLVTALARLETFAFDVAPDPLLGSPTMQIGRVRGGVGVNVTPDYAEAELDIRLLPNQDANAVTEALRALVGDDVTLERIDLKPAVVTPASHPFVSICRANCEAELGRPLQPIGLSYFTDGAIICRALNLPMVIIGPGDIEMTHRHDEYCEIEKLVQGARIFTRIALSYLA